MVTECPNTLPAGLNWRAGQSLLWRLWFALLHIGNLILSWASSWLWCEALSVSVALWLVNSLKSFISHPVNVDDYLKWFSHINHFDSTKSVTIQGPGRQSPLNLLPISWGAGSCFANISQHQHTIFVLVLQDSAVQLVYSTLLVWERTTQLIRLHHCC